jgi:hypothetical protein
MKRTIARLILAGLLGAGIAQAASAGQWGTTTMVCMTEYGPGPVLIRPVSWLGRDCWLPSPYGPIQGVFVKF